MVMLGCLARQGKYARVRPQCADDTPLSLAYWHAHAHLIAIFI